MEASGLAGVWQAASVAGGSRGATADADLDAVAARCSTRRPGSPERLPPGSPRLFLDSLTGQEIAGDTLAERAQPGEAVAVRLRTGLRPGVGPRAGGRVQEGTWPTCGCAARRWYMDELVADLDGGGLDAGPGSRAASDVAAAALSSKLLDEERRLFYVAATRSRRSLVVTAVGGEDSEDRPSRFLAELAGDDIEIEHVTGAGRGWLSLPALTADLRRTVADPAVPAALRRAAATQLARLAAAGVRGASPRHWYALTEMSGPGPLTTGRVRLSPSQVENFTKCGLRWLIESAAGASSPSVLQHLGTVIHAAAVLAADGSDDAEITKRIDDIWHHLDFGSAWYSSKQREQAEKMVRRFLDWHKANPREVVGVERALRVQVGRVEITGRVDRLERDEDGRAVVVDLKTGTTRPPDGELDRNPQLGVYQLAVLIGAFEALGLTEPGGAELVQVGKAACAPRPGPAPARAGRRPRPGLGPGAVDTVAAGMAGSVFTAKVNPGCRVCPVAACCPCTNAAAGWPHDRGPVRPAQLARLLGVTERPPSRPR